MKKLLMNGLSFGLISVFSLGSQCGLQNEDRGHDYDDDGQTDSSSPATPRNDDQHDDDEAAKMRGTSRDANEPGDVGLKNEGESGNILDETHGTDTGGSGGLTGGKLPEGDQD